MYNTVNMQNLNQLLTRNVKIFYIDKFLEWFSWFWAPIIVAFQMHDLGLSLSQVLLWESFFAFAILLCEIPTWMLADKIGRRNSLIIWEIIALAAIVIFAFSNSFFEVILSQVFMWIWFTFRSWADSALLYDSLREINEEKKYKSILSKQNTINFSIAVFANIIWWFIAEYFGLRYAIIASASILVLSTINLFFIKETTIHIYEKVNNNLQTSIYKSLRYAWKHKIIKYVIILSVIIGLWLKIEWQTLNPYWTIYNVPLYMFGFAVAWYNAFAALISHYGHKIVEKYWDIYIYKLTIIILVLTFLLMTIPGIWFYWAILIPTLFQIPRILSKIVESDIINSITYSHHRATVLSIRSFCNQWVEMIFMPVLWYFADLYSLLAMYLILWILILIFWWFMTYKLSFLYDNGYEHGKKII